MVLFYFGVCPEVGLLAIIIGCVSLKKDKTKWGL